MKDDLISRKAAIDKMMDLYNEDVELYGVPIPEGFDGHRAVEAIKEIPPAEPERKQGEWMSMHDFKTDEYVVACSNCNMTTRISCETIINADVIQPYKFCPNCGAEMTNVIQRSDKSETD